MSKDETEFIDLWIMMQKAKGLRELNKEITKRNHLIKELEERIDGIQVEIELINNERYKRKRLGPRAFASRVEKWKEKRKAEFSKAVSNMEAPK